MERILHQLIDSLSHYLQGFIHTRWLALGFLNHQHYLEGMHMFKHIYIYIHCIQHASLDKVAGFSRTYAPKNEPVRLNFLHVTSYSMMPYFSSTHWDTPQKNMGKLKMGPLKRDVSMHVGRFFSRSIARSPTNTYPPNQPANNQQPITPLSSLQVSMFWSSRNNGSHRSQEKYILEAFQKSPTQPVIAI